MRASLRAELRRTLGELRGLDPAATARRIARVTARYAVLSTAAVAATIALLVAVLVGNVAEDAPEQLDLRIIAFEPPPEPPPVAEPPPEKTRPVRVVREETPSESAGRATAPTRPAIDPVSERVATWRRPSLPPVSAPPLPEAPFPSGSDATWLAPDRIAPAFSESTRPDLALADHPTRTPVPGSALRESSPVAREIVGAPPPVKHATPSGETSILGVPLDALAACRTDAEEDRLKRALIATVDVQGTCKSDAGTYHFLELENLNAFLMRIERNPSREVVNRCRELGFALECLASQRREESRQS